MPIYLKVMIFTFVGLCILYVLKKLFLYIRFIILRQICLTGVAACSVALTCYKSLSKEDLDKLIKLNKKLTKFIHHPQLMHYVNTVNFITNEIIKKRQE